MTIDRRTFLALAPTGLFIRPAQGAQPATNGNTIPDSFPSQDPALAREMVSVAHGKAPRVRELLEAHPALAKAAWDWGYGDWETALGAASHVGNREIAEMLLAAGAGPTIFSAAMLGQLGAVQAFVAASPGVQRTKGPHGIPLIDHARAGKAAEVIKYLESLGDADPRYTNEALTDADRTAVSGTFVFGPGATEQLVVASNARGMLVIQRTGGFERNLLHLGARVFHPVGAEAVRIRFAPGDPSPSVSVEDGPLSVVAKRK